MRVDSVQSVLRGQYFSLARALVYPLGAWGGMIGLATLFDRRRFYL
jgi:hypothetical protein